MIPELNTMANFSIGNIMDLMDADKLQSRVPTLKGQK
jgi:hypothetical protein